MKAFVVTRYDPDGLQETEVPAPTVGPRDVLVDIRAASINLLDTMVGNGEFKQLISYERSRRCTTPARSAPSSTGPSPSTGPSRRSPTSSRARPRARSC